MITVTLNFSGPAPQEPARRLEVLASISGRSLLVSEAERYWQYVLPEVELYLRELRSVTFVESGFAWRRDIAGVVAAVLAPDDVQPPANPPSEYRPTLPKPCIGFLPEEAVLRLAERPRGHLAGVGEEAVVSAKLARFLGDLGGVRLGEVSYRGQKLASWHRLFLDREVAVLSDASRKRPVPCSLCGVELVNDTGIWVSRSGLSLPQGVWKDRLGFGHLLNSHPIIVERESAFEIAQIFGTGLAIRPVYSPDSAQGRLVLRILEETTRIPSDSNQATPYH